MDKNKFEELDKQVTKVVMQEFQGTEVDIICPYCNGEHSELCENCDSEGHYLIEY